MLCYKYSVTRETQKAKYNTVTTLIQLQYSKFGSIWIVTTILENNKKKYVRECWEKAFLCEFFTAFSAQSMYYLEGLKSEIVFKMDNMGDLGSQQHSFKVHFPVDSAIIGSPYSCFHLVGFDISLFTAMYGSISFTSVFTTLTLLFTPALNGSACKSWFVHF